MTLTVSHSWAISAAACAAKRLQLATTTDWNVARAEREAHSVIWLDFIGPGLPRHYRTLPIGGRKIGDGKTKVATIWAARLINEFPGVVL